MSLFIYKCAYLHKIIGILFAESSFNGEMEAEYHCWGGYAGCPGDGEGEYLKNQQRVGFV